MKFKSSPSVLAFPHRFHLWLYGNYPHTSHALTFVGQLVKTRFENLWCWTVVLTTINLGWAFQSCFPMASWTPFSVQITCAALYHGLQPPSFEPAVNLPDFSHLIHPFNGAFEYFSSPQGQRSSPWRTSRFVLPASRHIFLLCCPLLQSSFTFFDPFIRGMQQILYLVWFFWTLD